MQYCSMPQPGEKLWDEANWIAARRYLHEKNIRTILPWGSESERLRSLRFAESILVL